MNLPDWTVWVGQAMSVWGRLGMAPFLIVGLAVLTALLSRAANVLLGSLFGQFSPVVRLVWAAGFVLAALGLFGRGVVSGLFGQAVRLRSIWSELESS